MSTRRQIRRARRAGVRSIVVIDQEQLPMPAWLLLARLTWRYRSELAPAAAVGAVLGAGWWLHAACPGWWPFALALSDLVAFALAAFGEHLRLTRLGERVYAAAAVLAAGGWLAAAMIYGPSMSPVLLALLIGALIFAVPWWRHRRRRTRARVQRAFASWPDIARAIGLPGARIQSARIERWGWRARVKLAYGQTTTDLTVRIPAIESALGTRRGAVSIYSTGDDPANWCELRVLDISPQTQAVSWAVPSARSITHLVKFGPSEDARPCWISLLRRHTVVVGEEGDGLNVLIATLAACDDVVIWAVDLGNGTELEPWSPCIDQLATTPAEAAALLADAVTVLQARAEHLTAVGRQTWEPAPAMPALVIVIGEFAEPAHRMPAALGDIGSIADRGRATAVTLLGATQWPEYAALAQDALRSQVDTWIWLDAPGQFLVSTPEHTAPRRTGSYLVSDEDVARTVAYFGPRRPRLDDLSRNALNGWRY